MSTKWCPGLDRLPPTWMLGSSRFLLPRFLLRSAFMATTVVAITTTVMTTSETQRILHTPNHGSIIDTTQSPEWTASISDNWDVRQTMLHERYSG